MGAIYIVVTAYQPMGEVWLNWVTQSSKVADKLMDRLVREGYDSVDWFYANPAAAPKEDWVSAFPQR